MMRKAMRSAFLFSLFISVIWCIQCAKHDPVLAVIGIDETIRASDLNLDFTQDKPAVYTYKDINDRLTQFIDDELRFRAGMDQRMDTLEAVRKAMEDEKRRYLLELLFQKEIIDDVIPESDIRDYYARTAREVLIRKIVFRLPLKAGEEEKEAVRKKAQAVLEEIRQGADFNAMRRMHSEVRNAEDRRGLIGPLTWTHPGDPIREAAFSMDEGQISDLIINSDGFNIIKVEEVHMRKRRPYIEEREKIKSQLMNLSRPQINEASNAYLNRVKEDAGVQWHMDAVDSLSSWIATFPDLRQDLFIDSLAALTPEELKTPMITYKGGAITYKTFKDRFAEIPVSSLRIMRNPGAIKNLANNYLIYELLPPIAVRKGYIKTKNYKKHMQERLRSEIVNLVRDQEQTGRSLPAEEDIRAYFDDNPGRYAVPEKVKVQEILVKDSLLAVRLVNAIRQGGDMGMLAQEHTIRIGMKDKKGIMAPFERGRYGRMGETAFTMSPGDLAGPVRSGEDRFSVIKCLGRIEAIPQPYENVRDRVAWDLQREWEKMNTEKRRAELWEKYQVKVFKNEIEKLAQDRDA